MTTNNSINVATGASNTVLQGQGSGTTPAFSTATYPATTTINQVLYSSAANTVAGVTAANNGTMISGTTGVPSWLANGTTGQVLTATTGSPPSWATTSSSGISVVAGQIFTASGAFTYTPTANMKYVIVELIGGGGGSGGIANSGSNAGASAGGGGGAYARFILTAAQVGVSLTGSVGAAGAAGTAGANNGGDGGNTTLATTSAWTVGGGVHSTGVTPLAGIFVATGGAGGTVTTGTGTILSSVAGGPGGASFSIAVASIKISGYGGSSAFGFGGASKATIATSANTTGSAGTTYGGGGGGSIMSGSVTDQAGAAGAVGVAIFTEYC